MLSGSGIGSLGIGVGADPFLGGSFGGMPDFGPGGIGGALGVPLGVDFNVNIGNASNLGLLNRVSAAVNKLTPEQIAAARKASESRALAPAINTVEDQLATAGRVEELIGGVAPALQSPVVPEPLPDTFEPVFTGTAAIELTGERDFDDIIKNARDQQSSAQFQQYLKEQKAAGNPQYQDYIYGLPGGKPGVLEIGINDEGVKNEFYRVIPYSTPEEYREAYDLKRNTPTPPESWRMNTRPWIKAAIAGLAAPFIPGAAAGIAGALGGGALASAATGAALGSGLAAATGQDPVKGALTGALGGFGKAATAGQAGSGASGIASLADTASTGASVADTASGAGRALEVLGTVADVARSPIVNAAREYMEARDERPGYTPRLPGQIDVVNIPTEAPSAPAAPGVDISAPVISQEELDRIEQEREAERQRQESEAARERQRQEAEAKAQAEAEAEAQRKRDEEAKAKAEREAAEAKAKAEADAKAKAEAEAQAERKRDAEAKAKAEREAAEAKAEAERKAAEERANQDYGDSDFGNWQPDAGSGRGWVYEGVDPNTGEGIFRSERDPGKVMRDRNPSPNLIIGEKYVDANAGVEDADTDTADSVVNDRIIEDGWVRNGPWRYDGEGIFTDVATGAVVYDPTVPEGIKVGDRFDAGGNNDAVPVEEPAEEPEDVAEDEPEDEVVIVTPDDFGTDAGAGAGADEGAGEPTGEGDATDAGADEESPISVTIGTGGLDGVGGGNGGDGGAGDGEPSGSEQPRGLTGIQALLPTVGLALLGRYLLGEAEKGQRRGRLPLEQESATGYYNIDREIRRRMGLGG